MSVDTDFEQLKMDIISACSLGASEATGFHSMYCPVCGKTSRKTAGFRFDQDSIGFNCFRASCDSSTVMEKGSPISRKFRSLMNTVGVTIPVTLMTAKSKIQRLMEEELDARLYEKNFYTEMKLPDDWVPLDPDNPKHDWWVDYLANRACSHHGVFYINEGYHKDQIGIGMWYFEKLIGAQIHEPDGKVKYITVTPNESPIMVRDKYLDDPVILVEGVLDSLCFPNTVATLRSRISPKQAFFLKGRNVIMLPDRSGNEFIDQMKDYGWSICIPPWDEKDLNAAVIRYGVPTVARMIKDNIITDPVQARVRYNLWIEKESK
ncbi:MAG: hypothetical protein CMF22_11640 [Idiomarinaceae bacterium]|nr:hypothetical protein [Idiomarinaceae bacterium]|tara:strand:- start:66454 stop:67413 length:960 start_codon:yes stop_codon:yes gene_type:complete